MVMFFKFSSKRWKVLLFNMNGGEVEETIEIRVKK